VDKLWEQPTPVFENPQIFYSEVFGRVIAEQSTFTEKYYPRSKYWSNVAEMERRCLCERVVSRIQPSYPADVLTRTITYIRPTSTGHIFKWMLDDDVQLLPSQTSAPEVEALRTWESTKHLPHVPYLQNVINLFDQFAVVTANCKNTRPYPPCSHE